MSNPFLFAMINVQIDFLEVVCPRYDDSMINTAEDFQSAFTAGDEL
jgi:hypothetical protein